MARRKITAEITGPEGTASYQGVVMGALEGTPLALRLISWSAEALGDMVGDVKIGETEGPTDLAKIAPAFLSLKPAQMGKALAHVATCLLRDGGVSTVVGLFRACKVYRSVGGAKGDSLSDEPTWDQVYAGNYAELVRATVWLLRENFAPFLPVATTD